MNKELEKIINERIDRLSHEELKESYKVLRKTRHEKFNSLSDKINDAVKQFEEHLDRTYADDLGSLDYDLDSIAFYTGLMRGCVYDSLWDEELMREENKKEEILKCRTQKING